MSLTLAEIAERLTHRYDHEELCDLLGITTEELLEKFWDKLAANYDTLCEELEDG